MTTIATPNTLVSLATKKSSEIIRHEFTKDELIMMKDTITHNLEVLRKKQQELKNIKQEFKGEMKPLYAENELLLENVIRGFADTEKMVLLVPDYENKIMELYDEDTGLKVGERRMLMSEFQLEMNFPK
ncbi:MAG: hypothetical protein M9904_02475 [Chitinophagaceae bacterium]|nr:hypothetical protein [Chitinophagaceae bacterium]